MKKILSIILVVCLSISTLAVVSIMAKGEEGGNYLHIKNDVTSARAMSLAFPNYTIPSNAAKITMNVKSSAENTIANGFSLRTDDKAVVSTGQINYPLSFTTQWNTIELDISTITKSNFKTYVIRLLDNANDYYFDDLKFVDASGNTISVIEDYESYAVGSAVTLAGNSWTGINIIENDNQGTTAPASNKYLHIKNDVATARAMSLSFPNSTIPSAATAITMKVKAAFAETIATGLSIRKYTNGTGTDGQINKALIFTTEWNTITIDITDVSKTDYHSYAIRLMDNANDYYFDDIKFVDANGALVSIIETYETYTVGSRLPVAGGEWTGTNEILQEDSHSDITSTTTTTTTTTTPTTSTTTSSGVVITTNKYLHLKNNVTVARAMSLAFPSNTIPSTATKITMKVKSSAAHTLDTGFSIRTDNSGLISTNQVSYPINYTTDWQTVSMDISSVTNSSYHSYVIRLMDDANDYYFDDLKFVNAQGETISVFQDYESYEVGASVAVAGGSWEGTNEVLQDRISSNQNTVTIDGTSIKVNNGEEFAFPKLYANGIAYTDGTKYYAENEKITVNSDLQFTTISLKLDMISGAQMRLYDITAIRFLTKVDLSSIENFKSLGGTINGAGTLIGSNELIGSDDLTTALDSSKFRTVSYDTNNGWYNYDNQSCIAGSIKVNLTNHIDYEFVGRGFLTVSIGGVNKTVYANYCDEKVENSIRSIGWISTQVKKSAEYETMSANQKAVVDNISKQFYDLKNISVEYFKYTTPNATNTGTTTDTGAIMLPKTYTKNGAPSRLVIDCHGYGYTLSSTSNTFYVGRFNWIDTLAHDGYAVIEAVESPNHMGSPYAVQSYINAYKYAIEHYNVTEEVYVNGNSMGGLTSLNLVCSGELPVIAHSMQYPVLSAYRQAYYSTWDADNRMRFANWYNFDYPNNESGTAYNNSTFPFTQTLTSCTADEQKLYQDNFFKHIATNNSVFKYTNILNSTGTDFATGFEDFLSTTSESRITTIYNSIKINYPVPVYIQHCTGDTAAKVTWTRRFVASVNSGTANTAEVVYFDGSKHGGDIGNDVSYVANDGTTLNVKESSVNMSKYFTNIEIGAK